MALQGNPMALHRRRLESLLLVAGLLSGCNDDPTQAQLSGSVETESGTQGSGSDDVMPPDGSTGGSMTTQGSMSASDGDSTVTPDPTTSGPDPDSTSGEPPTDDSSTSSGSGGVTEDTGSTGDTEGAIPCLDVADCDDLLFCNGPEACVDGFCQAGVPRVCDDGVDCTTDACDETADACVSIADDDACGDGTFCNGAETCDPFQGCQAGTPIVCDDAIECTDDSCNEATDSCSFAPDASSCQDDSVCNGAEVCTPGVGCGAAAEPLDCNDLVGCTTDTCSELAGGCVNTPDSTQCDNGEFCDGAETCMAGIGCIDLPDVSCVDDGVDCTIEACDETADGCVVTLDNTVCTAQGLQFCTLGGCVSGQQCEADGDCDDGLGCNGEETCACDTPPCSLPGNPGVCQPGTPVPCFDGIGCTADACVELGGGATQCTNTPQNGQCNDLNPCNGVETCSAATGCQNGAPPTCDDGIACTDNFCLPAFGCFNPGDDSVCDDGVFCNGAEVCSPGLGCEDQPFSCPPDGFSCTQEVCNEAFGGCQSVPNDDVCACGDHCEPGAAGADANGCTDQCSVATCEGQIWQCGNCIDDDGDCTVDDGDADCFGVCDNNEAGFAGLIPGQNSAPCKMDCYFDNDSGSGNDDCNWSHDCDPLNPQPASCDCEPDPGQMLCDANIPGYNGSCEDAWTAQSQTCLDVCGPVTPNGCDCFGCCEVTFDDGSQSTIYLGSEEPGSTPSCNAAVIDDPLLCKPCTQVQACLNTCDDCELCFGQTELPPECGGVPECTGENPQPCGLPTLPDCPAGQFCLTGCCSSF
jgi:hypothetical protein